jgi:hypothetical protein
MALPFANCLALTVVLGHAYATYATRLAECIYVVLIVSRALSVALVALHA